MTRSSMLRLVLALSCLPLAACGRDAFAGGQREGEVSAVAVSRPEGAQGSRAQAARLPSGASAAEGAIPQGTVRFQAALRLVNDAGEEVPLTGGFVPAAVSIAGADSALLARDSVEARSYTRVRVLFARVAADVTGGLAVGGVPLLGEVRVQIAEGAPLVVERAVALEVGGRLPQRVVIDLNAHAWLAAAAAAGLPGQGGTVPAAVFAAAVEIRAGS